MFKTASTIMVYCSQKISNADIIQPAASYNIDGSSFIPPETTGALAIVFFVAYSGKTSRRRLNPKSADDQRARRTAEVEPHRDNSKDTVS
uniref:Uncharacterized protein n=1 Tax=Romanomermis culicivorax TaxID=13658 RepID=A0A915KPN4_ROMCU